MNYTGDNMEFNYYEKEHMKCSLYNFLRFYEIDLILNNNLIDYRYDFSFEMINYDRMEEVFELNEYPDSLDIYQYFIFKEADLRYLKLLNEPIFYSYELDLYLLGITHYGTGWDYVLTDINLIEDKNNEFKIDFKEVLERLQN